MRRVTRRICPGLTVTRNHVVALGQLDADMWLDIFWLHYGILIRPRFREDDAALF